VRELLQLLEIDCVSDILEELLRDGLVMQRGTMMVIGLRVVRGKRLLVRNVGIGED
jgi:acetate kinase